MLDIDRFRFYKRRDLTFTATEEGERLNLRIAAAGRHARTWEIRDSQTGNIASFSAVASDEKSAEAIDREMMGKGHVKEE